MQAISGRRHCAITRMAESFSGSIGAARIGECSTMEATK